jgi:rhamnose transport system permease protein
MEKIKEKFNIFNNIKVTEVGLIIFMIIAIIFIQYQNSNFLTTNNILAMLKNTSILGILATGMTLVMLTGGIDLSVGSVVALSGMTVGVIIRDYPNTPIFLAILIGMIVGLVSGFILGLIVSKGDVLPIIASLGMMNILRGLTYLVGDNAWISANEMSAEFIALSTGSLFGINYLIWITIIIFIIFYYILNYTRTGRNFYAIGSNREAVNITGINKDLNLIIAYSLNGLLSGLAGVLWVSRYASAQGNTAAGYEMNVIAAAVLGGVSIAGGVGKISGVILGTLAFGILNNALPLLGVSTFWQDAITGLVILSAVILNVFVERRSSKRNLRAKENE